jgi:hypothetical protein
LAVVVAATALYESFVVGIVSYLHASAVALLALVIAIVLASNNRVRSRAHVP